MAVDSVQIISIVVSMATLGKKIQMLRKSLVATRNVVKGLVRGILAVAPVNAISERLHKIQFAYAPWSNELCGRYATWIEAERAAPRTFPHGYNVSGTKGWYRDRIDHLNPTDYPALFWLRPLMPEIRKVFDFGGHVGLAYYAFEKYLAYPDQLHWTVCDVPVTVQEGEALAKDYKRNRLAFTSQFELAEGADVLYAAGSLQYVADGFLEAGLASLRRPPQHLLINRTPLHPHIGFATIQFVGVTYCAYTIAHRDAFVNGLARLGYELVDAWECPPALSR